MFTEEHTLQVIHRGDADYDWALDDAVWNARKPERYPRAIVRAQSAEDVVGAVRYAAEEDLRIGIRSGGHSWIAGGIRDDALLVDLSALSSVEVDADARIAVIEPGIRVLDLIRALEPTGLAFPAGHNPTVGLGGYILGGGYGWNGRSFGPACLSILEVDIVLADGTLVHATDESHPDIMWAVRGAGPGLFGIVTRLWVRLYPGYTQILQSHWVFDGSVRDELLAWSYEALDDSPTQVEMMALSVTDPATKQPLMVLDATAFCGEGEGAELLDFLADCPVRDRALLRVDAAPVTFEQLYAGAEAALPKGNRYSVDGIWCEGPVQEILAASAELFDTAPRDETFTLWMLWGEFPTRADACWSAQAKLYLSTSAGWTDPAEDYEHERWTHGGLEAVGHLSVGTQFSDSNPADRFDWGLSRPNAERLETLRAQYDPDGRFHTYLDAAESTTAYGKARRG